MILVSPKLHNTENYLSVTTAFQTKKSDKLTYHDSKGNTRLQWAFVSVYFVQIKFMQIVAQSLIPVDWRAMFKPVTAAAAAPHPRLQLPGS